MAQGVVLGHGRSVRFFLEEPPVTIRKTVGPGIVRRIDVDDVHPAAVGIVQARQSVVIVPLDQNMARLPIRVMDRPFRDFLKNWYPVFALLFKPFRYVKPDQTIPLLADLRLQPGDFFF
ncbi:MAG: hypothetical protein Q4A17_10925 [Thermoguttaceae bacterium]|nr:hypothetical protein [Thermoguttaceae bacterium]